MNELQKGALIRFFAFSLPMVILWIIDIFERGFLKRFLTPEILVSYLIAGSVLSWIHKKLTQKGPSENSSPIRRLKFIGSVLGIGGGLAFYGYTHDHKQILLIGIGLVLLSLLRLIWMIKK